MTTYGRKSANRGAGFTLVEILVVIVIIGLLAGMTSTVLVGARRSVRGSIVATQMSQLSTALDEYKNRYGEYPPDFSDSDAVLRHIKKRWPRYSVDYPTFLQQVKDGCQLSSAVDPTAALDGAHIWNVENGAYLSSLVFWLGGLPNADGKPSGFFANPRAPLGYYPDGTTVRVSKALREKPLFDFALKNVGAFALSGSAPDLFYCPVADKEAAPYIPAFVQGDLPMAYFRPTSGSPYASKGAFFAETQAETRNDAVGLSKVVPYARTFDADKNVVSYYEEKRFQLIHPGVDGYFGPDENTQARSAEPAVVDTKTNIFLEDDDNIVNFSSSGTLASEYGAAE